MKRRGFLKKFRGDQPAEPSAAKPLRAPVQGVPHVGSPGPRLFTNARLRTHENKEVRFYDDLIAGKQVLINLMYATCEGACPLITSRLVKVYDALKDRMGKDLFMYSITVKPEDDDPAALMHYAHMHGALKPGWTFLTGDPYDIETIRYRLFAMDHIAIDTNIYGHTSFLKIINDATNHSLHVDPQASLTTVLWKISMANPPMTQEQIFEENKKLQERIDKERRIYGYRMTI
ncbi:MAG TPA: SCO family protein [Blastocatellia bacterium]|nr:SCO family protein [Blastocatellia bacterium]